MSPSPARWVLALFFLGMVVIPQAASGAPSAGVKTGDWARYDVSQHVTGNAALVKYFVDNYSAYTNTNYVSLNVTELHGTNVSLTQGIHHADGTTLSFNSIVNVSLPIDYNNPPVIIMQNYPPTLSSVTNGSFFKVPRIVNNLEQSPSAGNASRYSWDEQTGILLSELLFYTVETNATNTGTFTYSLVMTSTSLWHYIPPKTPPIIAPPTAPFGLQFAELYALAGIIGSIAIGAVAFAMKKSPKSKARSRTRTRDQHRESRDFNRNKSTNG